MGLGWWMTEELTYDKDNGQLLSDNTWVSLQNNGYKSLIVWIEYEMVS